MFSLKIDNGFQLRRTAFVVFALAMFSCIDLGTAATPKSDPARMTRQGADAAQPRTSMVDTELRDRVVKLEVNEGAVDRRLDDVRASTAERVADNKALTYSLFGAVVAVIAAIGVPMIIRERREKKEIREFARGE